MTVLIVDNHDLILDSLSRSLAEHGLATKVVKASSGESAWEQVKTLKPNLVISDYRMSGMNGPELLIKVKEMQPAIRFLMISMIDEPVMIQNIRAKGADGFVHKESPKEELLAAVRSIAEGKSYFCWFTQQLLKNSSKSSVLFSKRELEILKLIVEEKKNQEIAELLFIDVSTVQTHKKNLIKKMGVKTAVGLVKYTLENKLFG